MSDGRTVVLYDDDCGFCRWSLGVLVRWDRRGRLRPLALQSAEAERLLDGIPEEQRMASLHVVGADGAVTAGGAALTTLARVLPGGAPLAAAGAALPGVTERGYRIVAGRRGALGRLITARARRRADALIADRQRRG